MARASLAMTPLDLHGASLLVQSVQDHPQVVRDDAVVPRSSGFIHDAGYFGFCFANTGVWTASTARGGVAKRSVAARDAAASGSGSSSTDYDSGSAQNLRRIHVCSLYMCRVTPRRSLQPDAGTTPLARGLQVLANSRCGCLWNAFSTPQYATHPGIKAKDLVPTHVDVVWKNGNFLIDFGTGPSLSPSGTGNWRFTTKDSAFYLISIVASNSSYTFFVPSSLATLSPPSPMEMVRLQVHRLEVSVSIAAASTVAALLVLAGLVQGQACDATQLAAWGNAASVNSACANNSACDCDPRVGNLSSYTEDLLPSGCVSSYPDPRICQGTFHNSGSDPCKPPDSSLSSGILLNQMVYIKDPENFCILLPNNQSKYLTHWYYGGNGNSNPPSIVQAEGFVQSFCAGSYMPSKSRAMPSGGIRSAHVVVNFTTTGARFIQISGTMDCGVLNINCQQSSPGAYDDGGQYDTSTYAQCGKEPYSGPDPSSPNPNTPFAAFNQYVEKAGDGIYCMRVCEGPDSSYDLGDPLGGHARTLAPCDSSQDTQGCEFWNANTGDGLIWWTLSLGRRPRCVGNGCECNGDLGGGDRVGRRDGVVDKVWGGWEALGSWR
ncbi:hypothetical protein DFJ73DRAFT_803588 [Zopfochytrium polystomum]|nr:hypothetical protein DFJ73DRAFT_803588 [Zopfochytrium polystomum]